MARNAQERIDRKAIGDSCIPDRHSRRDKGQYVHERDTHHLWLENPFQFRSALREHRHVAAERAGICPCRENEYGRVRHGFLYRELGLLLHPQPLGLGPCARRSSGGSASVVSSGEALFALGSDTGGSIRQPAGFCSVTGLKPTYGSVSRYGLVAFASSLDQIGPLTQDVADCALVMNTIGGYDSRDSTSVPYPTPDYACRLAKDLGGLRLGIPKEYYVEGMETGVATVMQEAIAKLAGLGAGIDREVSLPHTPYALAAYYIIAPSEASANLSRYDGVKYGFSYQEAETVWEAMEKTRQYGFGPEVKRRIMLGTYALSAGYYDAWYLKAQRVRTLIRQEFERAFEQVDALITPTSPSVPFKIGEKAADPLQMYLSDVCTIPVNIAGLPAVSIPAGFCDGLPVGMQIIGKPFSEETILRIAYAFQQATDWHKRRPQL